MSGNGPACGAGRGASAGPPRAGTCRRVWPGAGPPPTGPGPADPGLTRLSAGVDDAVVYDPKLVRVPLLTPTAPRPRGDGPVVDYDFIRAQICSPNARGWSHRSGVGRLLPDLLPARGGWSRLVDHVQVRGLLLPARAGMVPRTSCCIGPVRTAARTRGDGPSSPFSGSMASFCSPHARGWSPAGRRPPCSPHARGWSRRRQPAARCRPLLFARVGIVPRCRSPPRLVTLPAREWGWGGSAAGVCRSERQPCFCSRGGRPGCRCSIVMLWLRRRFRCRGRRVIILPTWRRSGV